MATQETEKKWIKTWEKAAVALAEVKIKELRAPDYYESNRALLNAMLIYAFEHRTIRLTSGLVEQQKIFMRIRSL